MAGPGYEEAVDLKPFLNKTVKCSKYVRYEPRTDSRDFTRALSFEPHDPMWMLARQWQFGRFKGDDCGSAVIAKVEESHTDLSLDGLGNIPFGVASDLSAVPLETVIERINVDIDLHVRIESAIRFKEMVEASAFRSKWPSVLAACKERFPLDSIYKDDDPQSLEGIRKRANTALAREWAVYGKRLFDGYKLFLVMKASNLTIPGFSDSDTGRQIMKEYLVYFQNRFLPAGPKGFWNGEKLGYEGRLNGDGTCFGMEDYHSGQLGWYSFDIERSRFSWGTPTQCKKYSFLPTPATFAAAPSRLLWEFEDQKVQMGNWSNEDVSQLASALVMQYAMMYGNDWMVIPIESKIGTLLRIPYITVRDTFGEEQHVGALNGISRNTAKDPESFSDAWSIFGSAYSTAYKDNRFTSLEHAILFPHTVLRTEESEPLEEVCFLRDEMANMVWGVESRIPDGCGGSMDGRTFSDKVLASVDAMVEKGEDVEAPAGAEYSFLMQNRVPVNWIPFIPQHIPGSYRETRFRRGRMPIWTGRYEPVLPSTRLLRVERDSAGRVIPRLINEEEILGYGTKVILTAQRTRWFMGQSALWYGFRKVISGYQANSGLMFDQLLPVSGKK